MLLEILLVVSLLGNGYQAMDNGKLSQSNKQLSQVVEEQDALIGEHYVKIGDYQEAIVEVEGVIKRIEADSAKKDIELEVLRYTNTDVRDYLRAEVPQSLADLLQASDQD